MVIERLRQMGDRLLVVRARAVVLARAAGAALVVEGHGLLRRFELTPEDFGRKHQVDERDAAALIREWRRQYKRWAAFAPEEVFAAKAGVVALMVLSAGLWSGAQALN